jgi:hypothetical protein
MPSLKIAGFDGLVPRASATMLGDTQAQQADNVKLYARELRYWRGPTLTESPATSNIKTIWRYYASGGSTYWLVWSNNVDVVTSPTTDTTDYRIYYTGDSVPKKSNLSLITTGAGDYPRGWLHMGVPAPTAAPTVTRVGSGAGPETRVYVYTHVSTFGSVTEESAPSAASSAVLCGTGDSVTVNGFAAAPSTNYNITHRRIYRVVSGTSTTGYQLVAEIPVGTASYSDSLTAAQLGEELGTIGWDVPPTTLSGLTVLPTGALCGFSGNTVYFSEPFYPHAWPSAYALNVPHEVVGLGVVGSSVVVATTRYPYFIHGGTPGNMSVERVPILEPCVSKNSIASTKDGILYASPNGLVALGAAARQVITNALFRRDEWQDLQPDIFKAAVYDGKYIAMYGDDVHKSFVLSSDDVPALSNISTQATALHIDSRTGDLYYVSLADNKIYKADDDEDNPLTFTWKSKRFALPQATSFSALRVDANYSQSDLADARAAQIAAIQASNAALFSGALGGALNEAALDVYDVNGSVLQNLPNTATNRTAQVLLYGENGELEASLEVTSWSPLRIPPFKSRQIEIQVVGNMDIRSVQLATTVAELHE